MVGLKGDINIKLKTYNYNPMERAIKVANEKFKINYDNIDINIKDSLSDILNKLREKVHDVR